jgi:DNA replication and repair protein RecF
MEAPGGDRRRVAFRRLGIEHFRNIDAAQFAPASRFNLVFGDNGQGKTSLIEALYVLATTRSFRTGRLLEVVGEGHERSRLSAQVESLGAMRRLRAELTVRAKSFSIDDKRPKRKLDYALSTPVVAFHPGDLGLVSGPESARRLLLDRVLVYLDPAGAEARLRYAEALRERQRILVERGPKARDLDAYEAVAAEQGRRFALGRGHVAAELLRHLAPSFERMGAPGLELSASYLAGGTTDQDEFLRQLTARRPQDSRRGSASFGPQKDALALSLAGRAARSHASQGQQRVLTLALKLAELACIREVTGHDPVLLLDDVSSELDQARTTAVFRFLEETQSQVFVTTTRPELFRQVDSSPTERADFRMAQGQLEVLTRPAAMALGK